MSCRLPSEVLVTSYGEIGLIMLEMPAKCLETFHFNHMMSIQLSELQSVFLYNKTLFPSV